ncbi:unnamed protein product [Mucor circinelloides]|uniref:Letm1 RBD domain-containing protein n=1 Tax=Mucor circinelloides f. circinelloides (strain 1006PhL) TaxID=1220926 RepID=S2JSE8_MUCC1|nr:hypothetical protein HMPREF1544_00308 [Mucor circinelloides 1006PhL]
MKPKSLLLRRSNAKPNHQAHDILKSIEEKQALDKKNAADQLEKSQQKKTMWQKIKAEAVHYWHGTKLLGLEVRISSRLTWKMLQGTKLSRRENRQLRRTTSDIVRLVPFAVFLIVPFMELLLPVALKLFPNMLPSTFENKKIQDEKKRKLLNVRLDMARFLQETIAESGSNNVSNSSDDMTAGQEFVQFFRKVRMTGEQASTDDLLKIASKFEEELTLDNLSRPQLVSICRYMNINAFGTDNFLRYQIRNRMHQLKKDDEAIQQEGIDHLTTMELNAACAARGIRTLGNTSQRLRQELAQWLDLHLEHHVPSTLLILSRAFSFTDRMTPEDALRATFNSLPDNLVNEAELQVLQTIGASTYKQKLDVLEQQEELIEDETEQEEKEEKARREEEEGKERSENEEQSDQDNLSEQQQSDLHEALNVLRSKVDGLEQRAQLNEIKFHYQDYKDLIEELKVATHNEPNVATLRLGKRLEKMLQVIDKELDSLEKSN